MRCIARAGVLAMMLIAWAASVAGAARTAETRPTTEPGRTGAAQWQREAMRYAGAIEDQETRSRAMSEMGYVLVRGGDLAGAKEAAGSIDSPQLCIYAHCHLAKEYQKRGEVAACTAELQEAGKVALGWDSNFGHSHVIQTMMELGRLEETIALADQIKLESDRNYAMRDVAARLAAQGKLEAAEKVVHEKLPAGWQSASLTAMAYACAQAMRIEDTQTLVERLTEQKAIDQTWLNLVQALAEAKRAPEAEPFAGRIKDGEMQGTARGLIAGAITKTQSAAEIQQLLQRAGTREEKLALYKALVTKQLEGADVAAAEGSIASSLEVIKTTPRAEQKSKFGTFDDALTVASVKAEYLEVARHLHAKGEREASRQRLAMAREAITALPQTAGIAKSALVMTLIQTQVALGEFSDARVTLQQLPNGFVKSSQAGQVAAGLIASGDIKTGMAVAELITDPLGRGGVVGGVVTALLQAVETQAAKEMLKKLGNTSEDAVAFRAAGRALAERGRAEELKQWLQEDWSDVAKAYLCIGVADTSAR